MALKVDVRVAPVALEDMGFMAYDIVSYSGAALVTFGLLWPKGDIWAPCDFGITSTWQACGATISTGWTACGAAPSTTWLPCS